MNEKNIEIWYETIIGIFKSGIPSFYKWNTRDDVTRVLKTMGESGVAVLRLPSGEHKPLYDARLSSNSEKHIALKIGKTLDDFVHLELSESPLNRYPKPKKETKKVVQMNYALLLDNFEDNGAFTYFQLLTNRGPHIIMANDSPLLGYNDYFNESNPDKLKSRIQELIKREF